MNDIAQERQRSLKFVQIVFAILALLSITAAVIVAMHGDDLGLPEASARTIAFALLAVGTFDTALLFMWERIFLRTQL